MSQAGRIFGAIALVAAALFAGLCAMSLAWLSPDGLSTLDARVFGYDADAARRYLAVLSEDGRALYLGLFRGLDTLFPVLAALAIGGAVWLNTRVWPAIRRVAALGTAAAYLLMDLAENAFVAQMLRNDGLVSEALVARASDMTQLKWLFLGLSLVQVAVLWRRNRETAQ